MEVLKSGFLGARSIAAEGNRRWSVRELGDSFAVLDTGCAALEGLAARVGVYLSERSEQVTTVHKAVGYLLMWMTSRSGSVCSLLLDGFPTDAGALMRSLLEAEALQRLIEKEPDRAEEWLAGALIPEALFLRAVDDDSAAVFRRTWANLGMVVHPNHVALVNQFESAEGSVTAGGARRSEQLYLLANTFGVEVRREIALIERLLPIDWPKPLIDKIRGLDEASDRLYAETRRRWPDKAS